MEPKSEGTILTILDKSNLGVKLLFKLSGYDDTI